MGFPHPRDALELLFAAKGLFVLTPVWALACAGLVVMWRRGARAETVVVAGIAVAFLIYNAGYTLHHDVASTLRPFAGFQGGARLLVPILPFLALPLGLIWRSFPLTTTTLALASITVTSVSIAADPLLVAEDAASWFHRLERGADQNGPVAQTVLHSVWHGGRLAQVLILLAVALAGVVLAGALTPFRFERRDALLAVVVLVAWRVVYVGAPIMLKVERLSGGWTGAAAVAGLAVAVPLTLALLARGQLLAALPALALVPLAWPDFAAHTGVSLAAVTAALAGLGALLARHRLALAWPALPSRRAG
jgi:hypothetical protein